MMTMWMVRCASGVNADYFLDEDVATLGYEEVRLDVNQHTDKAQLLSVLEKKWTSKKKGRLSTSLSQTWRFAKKIEKGDKIVTYKSATREYFVGEVVGDHKYVNINVEPDHAGSNKRNVSWDKDNPINRDDLTKRTKNMLGSSLTLFQFKDFAAKEIENLMQGEGAITPAEVQAAEIDQDEEEIVEDINNLKAQAHELIKDKVADLEWKEMEELVAAMLRAMGYKTLISPDGPDRGKDIIASPDGLGFEQPRIVAEVKHRAGTIDAPTIRSFIGGRHSSDKGLYVSTGGFTKDARYEAERAQIPIMLMDIDDLVKTLIENYENLDTATKILLPLSVVYWPTE